MAPTSLGKRQRPIRILVAAEHCFEALERAAVPFRIVAREHSGQDAGRRIAWDEHVSPVERTLFEVTWC